MSSLFQAKKIQKDKPVVTDEDRQTRQIRDKEDAPLPVDVFRDEDKLVIQTPIAGVNIEDVSVSISDDILTIEGKRFQSHEEKSPEYFSQECFWGEFSRSIVLPVPINTNKVTAFYRKGILRIEMPIVEEERTRIIPVKMEDA